jgi:hypothetical protein
LNHKPYLRYSFAAILVIFFFGIFSLWQGIYSVDPHHWWLMLSNTKDMTNFDIFNANENLQLVILQP